MTLIQKLNKELAKVNLEFKQTKELAEKFRGVLVDKEQGIEIKYEVPKILQWNKVNSFAQNCRSHIDMYIQLKEMKGGNQ